MVSLQSPQPFSESSALWAYLKAPSSCPRDAQAFPVSSSLSLSLAATKWGGDSKQDLVWEWAASKEPHQQPSPAFMGGWRALNPRGRERRAYALESLFPAPRPGGPSGARSPRP